MLNNKISNSNMNTPQNTSSSQITQNSTSYAKSSSNSTAGLTNGQVVRGEVLDVSNNEVSVKLEDGRIINGKLEDATTLSIGDKVTFRVDDVSLEHLLLKILPASMDALQDTTIDKALDAAGFIKNVRNRTIVNELLKLQMSIDKASISQIMQQSTRYKNCPIESLIRMNKYNIPITESNINGFLSYTNHEHSILNNMNQLAETYSNLFTESIENNEDSLTQGKLLINKLLQTDSPLLYASNKNAIDTPLNEHERSQLTNLLRYNQITNTAISNDFLLSLNNKTVTWKETSELLTSLLNASASGQLDIPENIRQDMKQFVTLLDETMLTKETSTSSTPNSDNINSNHQPINSFLNIEQRTHLLSLLENSTISLSNKEAIQLGTITVHDLFLCIKENTESLTAHDMKSLLTSDVMKEIIKQDQLIKWTIPLDSLKDIDMDSYYESIYKQLEDVKEFASQSLHGTNTTVLNQANHMQENISFMNTLNTMFPYIQLPIKFHNQNSNTELYVYSRKKSGNKDKDTISALLHLDMDHLGAIDIFVELHHHTIHSKFYLDDPDTVTLIESHIDLLSEVLHKKGYELSSEVIEREKEINLVDEFLGQEDSNATLTRYNFDQRA